MGKQFNLFGKQLSFTDEQENYNFIRSEMHGLALSVDFTEQYKKRFSNIDEAARGLKDLAASYREAPVNWVLRFLADKGIYEFDHDRIVNVVLMQSGVYDQVEEACEGITGQYYGIVDAVQSNREAREERKENRSRVEGMGFGVDGFISSQISAGMMNGLSGLAHSAVNAVGNAYDARQASKMKSALFEEEEPIYKIEYAIKQMYLDFAAVIADLLTENTSFHSKYPLENECISHEAIINNINAGIISNPDIVLQKCIDILEVNPYNTNVYEIIRNVFNDPNGELGELESHFNEDELKIHIRNEISALLQKVDFLNISAIEQVKKSITECAIKYHADTTPYFSCLDNVIALIDDTQKSADGEVYPSTKLAEEATVAIKGYIEKANALKGNDKDAIEGLLKDIENSDIRSKDKYITALKEALSEEDTRFRTVKGVLYETREQAVIARKDAVTLDEMLKDLSSKERILAARKEAASVSTENLKEPYLSYINICEELWDSQDISAFCDDITVCKTRTELAKNYYRAWRIDQGAERYNVINTEFKNWFDAFRKKYTTVNGTDYSDGFVADSAYYDCLKKARNYNNYITEKNDTSKKGLFAKMKTGLNGVLNSGHEAEYNYITLNGTLELPDPSVDDLVNVHTIYGQEKEKLLPSPAEDPRFEILQISADQENKDIDLSCLFIEKPEADKKQINTIMSECGIIPFKLETIDLSPTMI